MKKKIISLLIILSLMCSFIPGFSSQSYAADEPTVLEEVYGNKEKIENAVDALRNYYLNSDNDFTFRVAMGYHFTSDNLEKDLPIIGQRYKESENPDSASACAGNIMGLIAAGKDPRD